MQIPNAITIHRNGKQHLQPTHKPATYATRTHTNTLCSLHKHQQHMQPTHMPRQLQSTHIHTHMHHGHVPNTCESETTTKADSTDICTNAYATYTHNQTNTCSLQLNQNKHMHPTHIPKPFTSYTCTNAYATHT